MAHLSPPKEGNAVPEAVKSEHRGCGGERRGQRALGSDLGAQTALLRLLKKLHAAQKKSLLPQTQRNEKMDTGCFSLLRTYPNEGPHRFAQAEASIKAAFRFLDLHHSGLLL